MSLSEKQSVRSGSRVSSSVSVKSDRSKGSLPPELREKQTSSIKRHEPKEPSGASGLIGQDRDKGVRSQKGTDGLKDRGGVQDPEVEGGDRGSSHLGRSWRLEVHPDGAD